MCRFADVRHYGVAGLWGDASRWRFAGGHRGHRSGIARHRGLLAKPERRPRGDQRSGIVDGVGAGGVVCHKPRAGDCCRRGDGRAAGLSGEASPLCPQSID
ncbi:hypothetical protein D3C86_1153890 [compost metagenome]